MPDIAEVVSYNSALVWYFQRVVYNNLCLRLSFSFLYLSVLFSPLLLQLFREAIKLQSRVTIQRTTIFLHVDVFMTAIAQHWFETSEPWIHHREIIIFICRFYCKLPLRQLSQIDMRWDSFPNHDCQFFDCCALTKGGTSCRWWQIPLNRKGGNILYGEVKMCRVWNGAFCVDQSRKFVHRRFGIAVALKFIRLWKWHVDWAVLCKNQLNHSRPRSFR